ncbi:MAG TPA: SpoIIE family protein phosphatase [Bacteroidia bacterium]|nr:SpoIIE family protein phosphatase [Bacteroidia bacterium]HNP99208.1 SpoIIE family protein phosphatase [Bacteroidia bacterium]
MEHLLQLYTSAPKGPDAQIFSDDITWFLIFSIIFILIGGIFYFRWVNRRFREENKNLTDKLSERAHQVMMQKWELERRNLTVSQQNAEIIDSLYYARNIQAAILPKTETITRNFKEAFVLYKPKDIVSGDFYFFEKFDNKVILAIADCTGHGVAGAFMSMVGSSLLHQITGQKHLMEPARILEALNDGIVEALKQKESDSHAGMDIALCCIDLVTKELKYAGANRPLYFIRDHQADSLKPDKLPIGGFRPDEDRVFTQQTLQLRENDTLYIYSDGYADQFGGVQGKKIMTKKFKELLLNIHDSPMKDQQKTLDEYFETWRGRYEQVDDVLVAGIRI